MVERKLSVLATGPVADPDEVALSEARDPRFEPLGDEVGRVGAYDQLAFALNPFRLSPRRRFSVLRAACRLLRPGGTLSWTGAHLASDDRELLRYIGFSGVEGAQAHKRDPGQPTRPLVSVVIPAFKPRFFKAALESVLAQTYQNLEIVIGDDCPTDAIEHITQAVAEQTLLPILYERHQPGLGELDNIEDTIKRSNGAFIKFLWDDDLLEPDCIKRLADGLQREPGATLAVCARTPIDEYDRPISNPPPNFRPPMTSDAVIDGQRWLQRCLVARSNLMGEPVTAMVRRVDLDWDAPSLVSFAGVPYRSINDVVLFSSLLLKGDAIFVHEPLASFRFHGGQELAREGWHDQANEAWDALEEQAAQIGAFEPDLIVDPRALSTRDAAPRADLRPITRALANGEELAAQAAFKTRRLGRTCYALRSGWYYDAAGLRVDSAAGAIIALLPIPFATEVFLRFAGSQDAPGLRCFVDDVEIAAARVGPESGFEFRFLLTPSEAERLLRLTPQHPGSGSEVLTVAAFNPLCRMPPDRDTLAPQIEAGRT